MMVGMFERFTDITVEPARAEVVRVVGLGEEVTSGRIPFAPRTKKVLEMALREALSLGHDYVGIEHLLLGLLRENEGVAARILFNFDADPETNPQRGHFDALLSPRASAFGGAGYGADGGERASTAQEGKFERFTERARKVIELAHEEAFALKHDYIGTEHILLGLARENEGVAARIPARL